MGIHSSNQLSEKDIYVNTYCSFINHAIIFVIIINYKLVYKLVINTACYIVTVHTTLFVSASCE
jgi:hypothetical protein